MESQKENAPQNTPQGTETTIHVHTKHLEVKVGSLEILNSGGLPHQTRIYIEGRPVTASRVFFVFDVRTGECDVQITYPAPLGLFGATAAQPADVPHHAGECPKELR
jgi:hypothetical protein